MLSPGLWMISMPSVCWCTGYFWSYSHFLAL